MAVHEFRPMHLQPLKALAFDATYESMNRSEVAVLALAAWFTQIRWQDLSSEDKKKKERRLIRKPAVRTPATRRGRNSPSSAQMHDEIKSWESKLKPWPPNSDK